MLTEYPSTDIFNSMRRYVSEKISPPYELQDVGYQGRGDSDEDFFVYVKQKFDNLIESMKETLESDDVNFAQKEEDYENFIKNLNKFNVGMGSWYSLPADKNYEFKIRSIDFKEGTVDTVVKSARTGTVTEHNPTYEEFITLLYNYQLFR